MFQTCLLDACLLGKDLAVANEDWLLEFNKNNSQTLTNSHLSNGHFVWSRRKVRTITLILYFSLTVTTPQRERLLKRVPTAKVLGTCRQRAVYQRRTND